MPKPDMKLVTKLPHSGVDGAGKRHGKREGASREREYGVAVRISTVTWPAWIP